MDRLSARGGDVCADVAGTVAEQDAPAGAQGTAAPLVSVLGIATPSAKVAAMAKRGRSERMVGTPICCHVDKTLSGGPASTLAGDNPPMTEGVSIPAFVHERG